MGSGRLGLLALASTAILAACKKDKKGAAETDQPATETGAENYAGGGGGGSGGTTDLPVTPPVVLTLPQGTSLTSGVQSLRFEGNCVSGLDVVVTGDVTSADIQVPSSGALYLPCVADKFGFEISKTVDGVYKLQFAQGLLGVVPFSQPADFTWTVATSSGQSGLTVSSQSPSLSTPTQPGPPVITQPSGSGATTNGSSFTVSGTCDNNMQVVIGGSVTAQDVSAPSSGSNIANCVAGAFSFSFGKNADGQYLVSVLQRDPQSQLDSNTTDVTWIRDTLAPAPPSVTQPGQTPFYDSSSSLTITGTCEAGGQVYLTGADTMTVPCNNGQFSLASSKSTDGTYSYTVGQSDAVGNQSTTVGVQWVKSAAVMVPPTVTSPGASPSFSKTRNLTIYGGCTTNASVALGGAVSAAEVTNPAQSLTRTCVAGAYSFSISKSLDGTYDLQVAQTDPNTSAASAPVSLSWVVDNLPPAAPLIVTPAGGSLTSGDSSLAVLVQCELGSTINWSGTSTATWSGPTSGSGPCSANGDFAVSVSQSTDADYTVTLTQTDRAGNQSAGSTVTWTRDTTMLATPTLSSPNTSPVWTPSNTLVVSGSCTTNYSVDLGGDVTASEVSIPAGKLSQTCQNSQFSFTVSKANDGIYNLQVIQSDKSGVTTPKLDSAPAVIAWTIDRQVPANITITSPSQNPYTNGGGQLTILGACETGATVFIDGLTTPTSTCTNGAYQLSLSTSISGTYTYVVKQKDYALNTSTGLTFTWLVDTSLPPPPTVTSPSTSTVLSASSALTIAGGCTPGVNVVLGGQLLASDVSAPAGSLQQACGSNGSYSFTIAKGSDSTYAIDVSQERNGYYSSPVQIKWTRDTQAPVTTVTLVSSNPNVNLSASATISFTTEAGATSQCSLDGAAYQTCSSPFTFANVASGSRTAYVRSTDLAGNAGSAGSVTWSQASYNTVALYNFTSTSSVGNDSSLFPGAEHNNASQTGTATPTFATTGKFGTGGLFASGSSQFLVALDNGSQDLLANKMTIDAFVKLTSIPANGTSYVIASKMGSTAGNYGWRLALRRTSSTSTKLALSFSVALAGSTTTPTEKVSTTFSFGTSAFNHIAVTWNAGSVQFFINGTSYGSTTIGTAGSSKINATTADLRIGADGMSPYSYFNGVIDQLRLSQVVRWTSKFSVPTTAYTAD